MAALDLPAGGARLVEDPTRPKPEGWTRFVCFSDTHGVHDRIPKENRVEADVLLHSGDFTNTGELEEVQSLAEWFRAYPATHKVVIAGNHDITFHEDFYKRAWKRFHKKPYDCAQVLAALGDSCVYLEDSAAEVAGYQIYGSPWQPQFCDWAFNLYTKEETRAVWARIPPQDGLLCPDVLLTHGPPRGIGDKCESGFHAGCPELLKAIRQRGVPVNLAGHIHEGYGAVGDGVTLYVNASTCDFHYRPIQPPIVFDLPPPEELRRATARAAAERQPPAAGPAGAAAAGQAHQPGESAEP